jgi:AhpD family alkylhydroperoxidase
LALPEYEKIARMGRNTDPHAPGHIALIEESAASGEVAALYDHFRTHFGRPDIPGILKCFATHPPLLRQMMDLSEQLIFVDGSLGRRHKEMIATLVSTQNACPYCADSHGFFFRVHGGTSMALAAI